MIESTLSLLIEKRCWFLDLLMQHVGLSLTAIALATVAGLGIGIGIAQWKRSAKPVLALVNFVYTIPSIAMLGFLIPVTGIGNATAIVALSVYALLPMVRNTYTGLTSIDPVITEAARGMGSTDLQLLYRIELPLAAPVIMSGIRTTATMTIALAGIASFIGAGGLGVAIFRGITTNNLDMTLAGSILIALLAIVIDLVLGPAEKRTLRHLEPLRRRSPVARAFAAAFVAVALIAAGSAVANNEEGLGSLLPWQEKAPAVVNVATKPMTEQYILGEMLATLIEHDTDLSVKLTQGVGGGTSNIQPGMEKGDFDLYPEYTGTGWNAVLKHDSTYDESLFDTMQQEYQDRMSLTWIGLYGFNNTFGLAVSKQVAQQYNLHTYSDLARVAESLALGAEPDFFDRQDGYPGLQKAYGMNFANTRDMDISLKYRALFEGRVDAIVISTTDGQAADDRLVVLQDDKGFYPTYLCGSVVRVDTLNAHPELKAVLEKMRNLISDVDMARMNNEVETQGREPKAVADAFLVQKGLV